MAGGPSRAMLAELRSRPGHDSLLGTVMRWVLISISLLFLAALLFAPLITVFATALSKGVHAYLDAVDDPNTLSAIRLTLITAAVVVPANTVFGLAASWCIAKFEFKGKSFFTTLIDLPMAVSPVIAGLVYVLVFGLQGWFGGWLQDHNISIMFALPGIIIATMFVTLPYVARELIPLMQQLGNDEEEAAITLGAGAWLTFFRVTLPKVRWGLIYGIILCNARAMGEFGAVSVVSGHIRGLTNTLPLHVEILYREYNTVGAFAVASLLTLLAVVTLVIKTLLERLRIDPATTRLRWWLAGSEVVIVLMVAGGLSLYAGDRLRQVVDSQGTARVQLGGTMARETLRRMQEDALASARSIGDDPALQSALHGPDPPSI